MAFVTDKMVYCHLPRTGGSWFRKHVQNMGYTPSRARRYDEPWLAHEVGGSKHAFWSQLPKAILNGRAKVAILRDPTEWLQSYYWWLGRGKIKHGTNLTVNQAIPDELMFDECRFDTWEIFLADYLDKTPGRITELFKMYSEGADYIGWSSDLPGLVHILTQDGILQHKRYNATPDDARNGVSWSVDALDRIRETDAAAFAMKP